MIDDFLLQSHFLYEIILADEPTGALDSRSSDELLRLFGEVNAMGQTILMVTHSAKAASCAGRVLFIKDGEVFHQIYRGGETNDRFYQKITETLTLLSQRGLNAGHAVDGRSDSAEGRF